MNQPENAALCESRIPRIQHEHIGNVCEMHRSVIKTRVLLQQIDT